jgi:hypothetical protein
LTSLSRATTRKSAKRCYSQLSSPWKLLLHFFMAEQYKKDINMPQKKVEGWSAAILGIGYFFSLPWLQCFLFIAVTSQVHWIVEILLASCKWFTSLWSESRCWKRFATKWRKKNCIFKYLVARSTLTTSIAL